MSQGSVTLSPIHRTTNNISCGSSCSPKKDADAQENLKSSCKNPSPGSNKSCDIQEPSFSKNACSGVEDIEQKGADTLILSNKEGVRKLISMDVGNVD